MITLISSKKLRGYKIMRNTVELLHWIMVKNLHPNKLGSFKLKNWDHTSLSSLSLVFPKCHFFLPKLQICTFHRLVENLISTWMICFPHFYHNMFSRIFRIRIYKFFHQYFSVEQENKFIFLVKKGMFLSFEHLRK